MAGAVTAMPTPTAAMALMVTPTAAVVAMAVTVAVAAMVKAIAVITHILNLTPSFAILAAGSGKG